MIIDYMIQAVTFAAHTIFGWLPSVSLPSFLSSNPLSSSLGTSVGHWMTWESPFVDMSVLSLLFPSVLALMLVSLAAEIVWWIYDRVTDFLQDLP